MRQERGRRAGGARVTARARTAAPRPSADLKEMMSRLEQSLGPEAEQGLGWSPTDVTECQCYQANGG